MFNAFNRNLKFITLVAALFITSFSLTACTTGPKVPSSEALITASIGTLNTLKNRADLEKFNEQLKNAAGVAIFPSVYKAGFFIGAEGGNGLLMAKDANGNWGYPAFYTLASGSWGLQFGGQKSGVIFILRSPGAVAALMKHQGKVSADAGVAAGHVGTGLEGSITTNLGADIIAYSDSKGLYGGVSLEGSAVIRRNDLNSEYYGGQVEPAAILIEHAHQNPQADGLRRSLNN
jgi:SH3 domain-containing YSC84-like protein 1